MQFLYQRGTDNRTSRNIRRAYVELFNIGMHYVERVHFIIQQWSTLHFSEYFNYVPAVNCADMRFI